MAVENRFDRRARRAAGLARARHPTLITDGAPLAVGVDGFSTAGLGSWLKLSSGSTSDLAAAAEMTVVAMFRIDVAPTTTEYIISKGGGAASDRGYAIHVQAGAALRCRFFGNAAMDYTPDSASGWAGKTFIAVGTANSSGQQFYLWHDGLAAPYLVGSVSTPSAPITDTRPLAIGALRGDNGTGEADNVTMIGAGVGYAHLTQVQVASLMAACKSQRKVVSFTGEAARWNQADGAGITEDQVGSYTLAKVEDTSTIDPVAEFQPTYHGDDLPTLLVIGQSNAEGHDTVANWSTSPVNYQTAYAAVQQHNDNGAVWRDLEPIGDGNAGPELSAGRDFDAIWSGDVKVVKHAVGGTDLASDWDPSGPGARWSGWTSQWDEAQSELPDPLDTLVVRCVAWVQGEADAQVEADANAYETNLSAFIDAVKAYTPLWSDWLFVIGRLPSFQTQTYKSTVIAAQDAVASARSDTVIINTDNLTDLDGLHYDAGSLESLGHAAEDAHTSRSNQTAAAP